MHDSRPTLRILMMIHTRWSRNLGGPRGQLELGEDLERLGCRVSKYSYEDAFPDADEPAGRLRAIWKSNRSFARRAAAFVRAHARDFDVIDANQTDLPFAKAQLGFDGLLVARSVGLVPEYDRFERWAASRWPAEIALRHRLLGSLSYFARRRRSRDVLPSFRHADLINVSSTDDLRIVRDAMGFGDRAVYFPLGIARRRLAALRAAAKTPRDRLAAKTVAFIGTWNSRKGSQDWPSIFTRLRELDAGARLLLLGTGIPEAHVRRAFPDAAQPSISVVTAYSSDELPVLLSGATVGAFPGYLEGFGFSVLEKIAAGLPTVAYDAPGPRDILGRVRDPVLVPRGDTEAFAQALSRLMALPEAAYDALACESHEAAGRFGWEDIARATLQTYRERLARLGTR